MIGIDGGARTAVDIDSRANFRRAASAGNCGFVRRGEEEELPEILEEFVDVARVPSEGRDGPRQASRESQKSDKWMSPGVRAHHHRPQI